MRTTNKRKTTTTICAFFSVVLIDTMRSNVEDIYGRWWYCCDDAVGKSVKMCLCKKVVGNAVQSNSIGFILHPPTKHKTDKVKDRLSDSH